MSADTNRSKMDLESLFDNLAEAVEHASPEDLLADGLPESLYLCDHSFT